MQYPVSMRIGDRTANRDQQSRSLARGQGAAADSLGQRFSLNQLHTEVREPRLLADLKDGHDMGMSQFSRGLRLGLKSPEIIRRRENSANHHLQGDITIQAALMGPVDDPHPATPNFNEIFIVREFSQHPIEGGFGLALRIQKQGRRARPQHVRQLGCPDEFPEILHQFGVI